MKKTILICYAFLCVTVTDAALSSYPVNICSQSKKEIELKGDLPGVSTKSAIRPIQAFIDTSELEVDFSYNLGDIDVVIYSEDGNTVYERSVDTSEEDQLLIDLSVLEPGIYEIRFINTEGQFMYGEFEID
jgi:hypothetical protein